MARKDPRVDAYIAKSADFAKPILVFLRSAVHEGCPDVEEDIKWGVPFFMYSGVLCQMAAFKQHCGFGFWNPKFVVDEQDKAGNEKYAGRFGRITTVSDLPAKKRMVDYVKAAAKLNEKAPAKMRVSKPKAARKTPAPRTPAALSKALEKNKKATATFDGFSPSHRKEYIEWIGEAKSDETRERRITQAVAWMAEGKPRNWKYMRSGKGA